MQQNIQVNQIDLQTHFVINEIAAAGDRKKAYLFWGSEKDGQYRALRELNLQQLGIEIIDTCHLRSGTGSILYRGSIGNRSYPKD
jgi:hypothetical protein